jgi:nitrogen fixation protein FixH
MNTKTLLTLSALALGLLPMGLPARADDMSGMDMGGAKMAQKPKAASLSVTATINPAAPRTGDNTLDLTILDGAGKPVTGLKLTTTVAMTSMDMGTTHPAVTETGSGHYTAKVNFGMDGPWRVVVRSQGSRVAVLDFKAGAKTPWKSPQIKAALAMPSVHAPTAQAMPGADEGGGMAGMNMGGSAAAPSKPATPDKAPTADGMTSTGSMPGMNMGGMKTGIADMKTAIVPQLQEKGTYTATGNEDWKAQTGFGHNAGMVGMMNQMMVGGSGMEGMKMAPMNMKFDEQNYAKPTGDDADAGDMAGMDMGGKPGGMGKPNSGKAGDMGGMNMAAPTTGGNVPTASGPVQITATTASAPKAGDNALTISITDAQGKPVTGAKITTSVAMTSMDMGTTRPAVTEKGGGNYTTTATFSMAGPWRVKVRVTPPGQKPQTKAFDFTAK